jgi:hypothetical protein
MLNGHGLGFQKELAIIRSYIDNFDPQEFTTAPGFAVGLATEMQIKSVQKLKARLHRRRRMEQRYLYGQFDYDDSDVLITQEKIDELLCKFKKQ